MKRYGSLLAALFFLFSLASVVFAEEQPRGQTVGSDEIQKLKERVGAIEAREVLERLEKEKAEDKKADEKKAGKSGYDNGFFVKSADDNFSLKINLAVQFRYTYLPFDEMVNANDEQWSNFMMRRARVWFTGNAPDKDWTYYVHVQLEPQSAVNLHDAYITWKKYPYAQNQIGRSKIPYGLEFWYSATQLNGIERSIFVGETDVDGKIDTTRKWPGGNANFPVSDEDTATKYPIGGLNLFRSQGFQLQGDVVGGKFQYWAGVYNGRNTKGSVNVDAEPLLAARVSLNPFGKCNLAQQGDYEGSQSPKFCVLASGMQYTDRLKTIYNAAGKSVAASAYNINVSGYNIAETFRYKGFSLDAEYGAESFEQDRSVNPAIAGDTGGYTWDRMGYRASAGYFVLSKKLEVIARYAYVERLKDNTKEDSLASGIGLVSVDGGASNAIEDSLSEITGGLNYYIDGYKLKVFVDYSYLTRALSSANPADSIDDQHDNRMRAMFQWAY